MIVYHKFQSLIGNVQPQKIQEVLAERLNVFQSLIGNVQRRSMGILYGEGKVSIPYR